MHPSFHSSAAYLGSGRSDSRFSLEVQTSLSSATIRPDKMCNPSSVFWVCLVVSYEKRHFNVVEVPREGPD